MEGKNYKNSKIAFIHGRPAPHSSHAFLAQSVNADFHLVDRILPYHELTNPSKLRKYSSWILNSIFFPDARDYDLILTEGPHTLPYIMKLLKLMSSHQKTASILGCETAFFLKTGYYPKSSQSFIKKVLFSFDALICLSKMQAEIMKELKIASASTTDIHLAHEVVDSERFDKFGNVTPKLEGKNLLFIGHGPSGWRGYYKGIEKLLETFSLVAKKHVDASLTVVGQWDADYVDSIISTVKYGTDRIHFAGIQSNLVPYFEKVDLCVHFTNGDAFPVATLEAIHAGVPTMVSEWTGTKEVISQINTHLVVPMNAEAISQRIEWYFSLSTEEKRKIAQTGRKIIEEKFNREIVIEEFRSAVNQILSKSVS